MSPVKPLTWFILAIAALLSIIALFLNIAVRIGLNDAEYLRLRAVQQKNAAQCNETQLILDSMSMVDETLKNTSVDTISVRQLEECQQYVRDRNPALMNASAVRLMELLEFNVTVVGPQLATLHPNLTAASNELETLANSLQRTGIIQTYQTGTVSVFQYALKSITMGGQEVFYVELPQTLGLIQVMMNTSDVLLDDWAPGIGSGCNSCTRVDPIMDRQQEKIMSAPSPIMFQSRSYPNGTDVLLSGLQTLMMGDFIGVADAVHMSF